MAKVYATQGHYENALKIYRHLAEQNPGRGDLKERCAEMEVLRSKVVRSRLCSRIQEWISLEFEHQRLILLKKIKTRYPASSDEASI
ncbi:MAG: hypothetical protein AB1659_09075 [Thermodesulfobacteriota bacterium]